MDKEQFLVERFFLLFIGFIGCILLLHTLLIKIFLEGLRFNYSDASCASGIAILLILYILTKFYRPLEKQISNFLYFKGKRHYKALLKEATRDGLTGLYSHKYIMLKLEEELDFSLRYKRPLSLLMIDIDHFKKYNDTFGHPQGDILLVKLGKVFKRFARRVDTVGRYGGEEFTIIMPDIPRDDARVRAERLRRFVKDMSKKGKGVTISIGVSSFDIPKGVFNKEDLVTASDRALYRAKTAGRNRVEIG